MMLRGYVQGVGCGADTLGLISFLPSEGLCPPVGCAYPGHSASSSPSLVTLQENTMCVP